MRKPVFILSFLLAGFFVKAQSKPFSDSTWQLAFHDEFNDTIVDANTWFGNWGGLPPMSYRIYWDWINNDWDTITNRDLLPYINPNFANCTVSSGSLKMVSREEDIDSCHVWDRWVPNSSTCYGQPQNPPVTCPVDSFVPFNYTTGLLVSRGTFKYGYYEIKMKMPDAASTFANQGLGPNFWLYTKNATCEWSEIDVFEFGGYEALSGITNYHTNNIHYQKCHPDSFGTQTTNPADTIHSWDPFSLGQISFSGNYHVFGINWLPGKIDFYYNGTLYKRSDLSTLFPDKLVEMQMFIELNHPTTNFNVLVDTAQTVFPFTYEVDYVRCWQYNQHCDSIMNTCGFTYASFDPAVYKQISVGGGGCNATIPATRNVAFRANDFIVLNEGFEVGNNATFLAEVTECLEYANPNRTPAPTIDPFNSPYLNTSRMKGQQ